MVLIDITATTRNGQHLETQQVRGPTVEATLQDRLRIVATLKARYRDHAGVEPYIFHSTRSVAS
jgi:hypothetical protein